MDYIEPELPPGVVVPDLVPSGRSGVELTPATRVQCVNRNCVPITDMWNAVRYEIPPGIFRVEYGAALHFQKRAVVPGTRAIATGAEESYIGIRNVDPPDWCKQFSLEQLALYATIPEAIDRKAFASQQARNVEIIDMGTARGRAPGMGMVAAAGLDGREQASDSAAEAAEEVLHQPAAFDAGEQPASAGAEEGAPAAPKLRGRARGRR